MPEILTKRFESHFHVALWASPPDTSSSSSSAATSTAASQFVGGGADVASEVVRRDVGDGQRRRPQVVAQTLRRFDVSVGGRGHADRRSGRTAGASDEVFLATPDEGDARSASGSACQRSLGTPLGGELPLKRGGNEGSV